MHEPNNRYYEADGHDRHCVASDPLQSRQLDEHASC